MPPVLCFGDDGHVLVEPAFHGESHASNPSKGRGVTAEESAAHGNCLDVALTLEETTQSRFEAPTFFPAPFAELIDLAPNLRPLSLVFDLARASLRCHRHDIVKSTVLQI